MSKAIRRFFWLSVGIGVVAVALVAIFAYGRPKFVSGAVVGALFGAGNLYMINRMVLALLQHPKSGKRAVLSIRFGLKYLLLGGLLVVTVVFLDLDLMGFLIGISNVPAAAMIGAVIPDFFSDEDPQTENSTNGENP